MGDDSREIKIVKSMLDDVLQSSESIKQGNINFPSSDVDKIFGGDLKIAKRDIEKLKKQRVDVSSLLAYYFCRRNPVFQNCKYSR